MRGLARRWLADPGPPGEPRLGGLGEGWRHWERIVPGAGGHLFAAVLAEAGPACLDVLPSSARDFAARRFCGSAAGERQATEPDTPFPGSGPAAVEHSGAAPGERVLSPLRVVAALSGITHLCDAVWLCVLGGERERWSVGTAVHCYRAARTHGSKVADAGLRAKEASLGSGSLRTASPGLAWEYLTCAHDANAAPGLRLRWLIAGFLTGRLAPAVVAECLYALAAGGLRHDGVPLWIGVARAAACSGAGCRGPFAVPAALLTPFLAPRPPGVGNVPDPGAARARRDLAAACDTASPDGALDVGPFLLLGLVDLPPLPRPRIDPLWELPRCPAPGGDGREPA
ncbi:hypothetical protein [Streptomyces sp. NPDC050560]|uniref:hypothetical protein n=1 Tax=Streptomyces sp. NPDC050560 TaxID=3365630 RepID=UPI0037905226